MKLLHHKPHGPQFSNNSYAKFVFYRFIWNRHGCHSFICIFWTLMSFILFKHDVIHIYSNCLDMVVVFICVVYTQKSFTWLPCLNNAQHSHLNNMNLWNNKFHTDLKWTHEAYKFVVYDQNIVKNKSQRLPFIKTMFLIVFESS